MVKVEDFKPERDFVVDETMTIEEVRRRFNQGIAITGKPKSFSATQGYVIVDLGNQIEGILPMDEVSLDEIKHNSEIPAQIRTIIRKPAIRVKVARIEDDVIYLSRKANLLETFEKIEKLGKVFFMSTIENVTQYNIFFDIGEGVIAYCNVCELSRIYLEDARNWVKVGNHIRVRLSRVNTDEKLIWCSVKKAYRDNYKMIVPKTKNTGRLGPIIKDEQGTITGYYVEITPAICGIVDVGEPHNPSFEPKFGQYYRFYVRSVDEKKHHIKLFFE